jgi:hypothetical protein
MSDDEAASYQPAASEPGPAIETSSLPDDYSNMAMLCCLPHYPLQPTRLSAAAPGLSGLIGDLAGARLDSLAPGSLFRPPRGGFLAWSC